MSPLLALTLTLLILVFALGLPTITRDLKRRRYRRDAERFAREPRVGDKAGYELDGNRWMVGIVVMHDNIACLETERVTAVGTVTSTGERDINSLRYFAPDTPLGIINMDRSEFN